MGQSGRHYDRGRGGALSHGPHGQGVHLAANITHFIEASERSMSVGRYQVSGRHAWGLAHCVQVGDIFLRMEGSVVAGVGELVAITAFPEEEQDHERGA